MNGTMPLISVIIPCYNDEKFIEKAVRSILAQTYKEIEIVVVDDGSNIATKRILDKLRPEISILITQENQGQGVARNNGIKQSKGRFILNLDSDDYFDPTFCAKAIKAFQNDDKISIVTCKARRFNNKGVIDVFTPRGGNIEDFLFSNSALGSSMFKRSDWEAVGGYDPSPSIRGFEDWEFYIQILKQGGYAFVIKEPLFNYQIRKNSTTFRIKGLTFEKYEFIILKHSDLYKNNFEELVRNFILKLRKEQGEKRKREELLEFKIGFWILKPFRKVKSLLK